MTELHVELYGQQIGTITGTSRSFDFVFAPGAIARYGVGSPILSVAVLTLLPPKRSARERRQNYFEELLPEGRNLTYLAAQARVRESDTLALLGRYGRDIAGALQMWDPQDRAEPLPASTEPVSESDIAAMLSDLTKTPLGNAPRGGKTSLAGVQGKIVLARVNHQWHRALNGYPSTHIVKPFTEDYPSMIFDEEYGSRVARALGLATFDTTLEDFAGTPALVIERYDRDPGVPGGRLHQEDFSQALGARGNEKYQNVGGRVSLARVVDVLAAHAGPEAVRTLARRVVMAVALGDLDMHTKNVSLIHHPDGSIELAPAYDVVPQTHLDNDGEVALAVDGVYRHSIVTAANLEREFQAWGVRNGAELIHETIEEVRSTVQVEVPASGAFSELQERISTMCGNLLAGKAAGA